MKCLDPKLCYRYDDGRKAVWRHWSFWRNSVFLRALKPHLVTNCDECIVCRKRRSLELAARCVLHSSLYIHNMFLTCTYDESLDGYHNDFVYKDIQDFKKRLRSYVWRNFGKRIEVFNVHEYGKNGKKHWHLIVFNFNFEDREVHTWKDGRPLFKSGELSKLWDHGFSTIGDVSEASSLYQAQYMEKDFVNGNVTSSKKSHSKHSGLGRPYFLKHYSQVLRLGYIPFSGRKLPVPRYFQRLAHKHWCHFNDKSAFFDTRERKALYRPFKFGEENCNISDLYSEFRSMKEERIFELEKEFEEVISSYIGSKLVPEFEQAGRNFEYDRLNRLTIERF